VIAREAAFNDAEVVKLLTEKFVPLSIDNVANPNLTAAEKEFLDGFDSGIKACTIGMSVFTADGKKLGSVSAKEPGPVRQMLQGALDVFKPESVSAVALPREGASSVRGLPGGGSILFVTWKVFCEDKSEGSLTTGNGKYDKLFQGSLGSDRLWVLR